ncbi:Ubiquitin-related domain [Phytophthora cactorum]|nr:Ubiquitin-related domain [Phytophthora cactorum]
MSTPPTVASMPEPAAEPPVSAESAQLSLKVRTLDQRTYPITICAAASVPQLKELVATETGVTLARQDSSTAAESLKRPNIGRVLAEDGHVLHLVVRATPASATPAPDPNAGQGAPPAGDGPLLRSSTWPPPPRDNDEPDPTMGRPGGGGLPSRVVMGATISMPEGADVTMPFLNSMMANLVTQVEGGEGLTAARGRRRATFSREVLGGGTAAEMEARRRERCVTTTGIVMDLDGNATDDALRPLVLTSVRATLDDASLDFPAELSALPQGDTNAAMAELQQQRFGPRLRLLSAALAQRDRMGVANGAAAGPAPAESTAVSSTGSAAAPTESSTASVGPTAAAPGSTTAATEAASDSTPNTGNAAAATTAEPAVSTRPVLRAIEALQTIGESTDMLARMARHAFVRQSALLGEPLSRRLSAYTVASDRIQAALDQGTTATGALLALLEVTERHVMRGVDVPRVTRPSIRTWAQDLVAELRRLLRLHSLPTDVVDPVTGPEERRAALGNELLRVMEPFIPDLVDYLVRATSASRAAAFGTSSATFLRTMAQQIVRQLRVYARGDSTESEDDSDERLKRLLRGLLVWLGVNEHIASFVVDSLLCWTEGDNASSRRGRTRQREETGSEDGATVRQLPSDDVI